MQELRSLDDTARFFDVSVPTVRSWIADGCPVHQRGGNGVAYQMDLRAVHAWREERFAAAERAKADVAERDQQLRLELLGDDGLTTKDADPLTHRQRVEILKAELAQINIARARGELVKAAEIQLELAQALATVRERVRSLPDQLAARFGLAQDVTDGMLTAIDDALEDLADDIAKLPAADEFALAG